MLSLLCFFDCVVLGMRIAIDIISYVFLILIVLTLVQMNREYCKLFKKANALEDKLIEKAKQYK